LVDEAGHGTHGAGIIAGAIQPWRDAAPSGSRRTATNVENPREPLRVPSKVPDMSLLAGIVLKARLVSLKVLPASGSLDDLVSRVIRALAYIREINSSSMEGMRIHGVNLSVGYEFNPEGFPCGQSPLCDEVDKLVRVVVAAGNSGYGKLTVEFSAPEKFALRMTINDPGNTDRAITVGATPRSAPHTYGVSYSSSQRPTGDGRRKPDLVAPGERITSWKEPGGGRRRTVGPDHDGRLCRGQRDKHGCAARLRRHRRVPLGPARVHRLPREGQTDHDRRGHVARSRWGVPGRLATRPDAGAAVGVSCQQISRRRR
jgi:serine protease AprX